MKTSFANTSIDRRKALGISVAAALVPAVLAACGGSEDEEPSVVLAAAPTAGAVGATITLVADAEDDDDDVREVRFYRLDGSTEVLLATVSASPYLFQTAIPVGAADSVTYLARAQDSEENIADSNTVQVTVST